MKVCTNAEVDLPSMDLSSLRQQYLSGLLTPEALLQKIRVALPAFDHLNCWITLLSPAQLQPYLDRLSGLAPEDLPLYGVPFAIKDNIDLAGVATTAACEAFSYTPDESAFVVQLLIDAGAIPVGKTNLDQFATGLVGVRSPEPWGVCRNAFDPDYISGGSSSGSAVALACGLVSFALGTDTAGSGRVPAALNNVLGLKPSKGLLSTRGVVPACRTLDCVSLFALSAADANTLLDLVSKADPQDDFSREYHFGNAMKRFGTLVEKPVIGVLAREQLEPLVEKATLQAYENFVSLLEQNGFVLRPVDYAPFSEAASLLYEGPWLAERYAAVSGYLEDMLPVTRQIIAAGNRQSAVETFQASYRLQALGKQAAQILAGVDAIVTPTVPAHFRVNEVLADPLGLNSRCGVFTNFMNLLDCAAVAVPAAFHENGLPFGVTFFAPAFEDKALLSIANAVEAITVLPAGIGTQVKTPLDLPPALNGEMDLAVCGAHLQSLPLNGQLLERNGRLLETTKTAACYRFYALAGGPPFRPGLIRCNSDESGGAAIEVEVWRISASAIGSFLAGIAPPLGLGKIELADGRWVNSFICEGYATETARDITQLGSWRKYLAS